MYIDFHTHNHPDSAVPAMIEYEKRLGVERLLLLGDVLDCVTFPPPERVRSINDRTFRLLERYGDMLSGCVYLNPGNPESFSLAELERACNYGCRGVKFEAGLRCSRPELDPILATAETHGMFVVQHTSWQSGDGIEGLSNPEDIAALARRHPAVTVVMAHLSLIGRRGILAVRDCPNVCVDTSGGFPSAGMVEFAVAALGARRVLFGSDIIGDCGRDPALQLGRVVSAGLDESALALVTAENARRLLYAD